MTNEDIQAEMEQRRLEGDQLLHLQDRKSQETERRKGQNLQLFRA